MHTEERDLDDVYLGGRAALQGCFAREAQIDEAPHAVVEQRLPARGRETAHVVGAHDPAGPRAATGGRFQAAEVADVETPVPRQRAVYGAHSAPR